MGVYNGAATLCETLDSILAQTESDFELIVVDDGSTDASPWILAEYAAREPRLRILTQANAGLTRALITGCAAARGTYVARHDAGDLSDPRRFAMQKQLLDADPTVVFVSCATQYSGPELEPIWVAHPTTAALSPANIIDLTGVKPLTDGPTHHGSVMFRRDTYERAGGYRAAFYYGQDHDLWHRLAMLGRFQTIDQALYTARLTADSISSSARHEQEQISALSRRALEARLRGEPEEPMLAAASAIGRVRSHRWCRQARGLYFIGEALRRNRDPRSRRYLLAAAVRCPFLAQAWVRLVQSLLS
jgi:hypothetical protein